MRWSTDHSPSAGEPGTVPPAAGCSRMFRGHREWAGTWMSPTPGPEVDFRSIDHA